LVRLGVEFRAAEMGDGVRSIARQRSGLLVDFPDASIVLADEAMATLTIRNVPEKVAKSLKALARKNHRSMEQEVRELISEHVGERASVLDQIEAAWGKQARRPSATEVEGWISSGRE
jgi:plasmid stability protein